MRPRRRDAGTCGGDGCAAPLLAALRPALRHRDARAAHEHPVVFMRDQVAVQNPLCAEIAREDKKMLVDGAPV